MLLQSFGGTTSLHITYPEDEDNKFPKVVIT
jgi:hypothetical protein